MARPKHQSARQRYDYRCGYCSVSETDSGGQLTVDHHRPVSAAGDDSDDNLVYACFRCNLYKGDFSPSKADAANGRRILHPLNDDMTAHIAEDFITHRLQPLTPTGRFHIQLLQLNRDELVAYRRRRRLALLDAARLEVQDAQIAELSRRVDELSALLMTLKRRLPPEEP